MGGWVGGWVGGRVAHPGSTEMGGSIFNVEISKCGSKCFMINDSCHLLNKCERQVQTNHTHVSCAITSS